MKKRLYLFDGLLPLSLTLLLFVFCLPIAADDFEEEELVIYKHILEKHVIPIGNTIKAINPQTQHLAEKPYKGSIPGMVAMVVAQYRKAAEMPLPNREKIAELKKDNKTSVSLYGKQVLLERFAKRNKQSYVIPKRFMDSLGEIITPEADHAAKVTFSRVAFDSQKACLFYYVYYNGLHAFAEFVFLEKINGKWVIEKNFHLWAA